jgi:hypothetical protein
VSIYPFVPAAPSCPSAQFTDTTFRHHSDVSANSARISLVVNGAVDSGYGTSYSSPIWASVITLVRLCTYVLAFDASTDSASAATD